VKNGIKLAFGIVANCDVCSGAPCISGRRVMTASIAGRFLAGDTVAEIAEDYETTTSDIENAIRYEFDRRKRRIPEFRATRDLKG